jgi:hypothetical protein
MFANRIAAALALAITTGVRTAMRKTLPCRCLGATLGIWSLTAAPGDAPGADLGAQKSAPAKCREALVNPVSGFAECVKPRGAPVAPPPKRPDAAADTGRADADHGR